MRVRDKKDILHQILHTDLPLTDEEFYRLMGNITSEEYIEVISSSDTSHSIKSRIKRARTLIRDTLDEMTFDGYQCRTEKLLYNFELITWIFFYFLMIFTISSLFIIQEFVIAIGIICFTFSSSLIIVKGKTLNKPVEIYQCSLLPEGLEYYPRKFHGLKSEKKLVIREEIRNYHIFIRTSQFIGRIEHYLNIIITITGRRDLKLVAICNGKSWKELSEIKNRINQCFQDQLKG